MKGRRVLRDLKVRKALKERRDLKEIIVLQAVL
jgi:hypothetical protein